MTLKKYTLFTILILSLVGCGLPRNAPRKYEILASSVERGGKTNIVYLSDDVVSKTNSSIRSDFPAFFKGADASNTDILKRGDRLSIIIYENVERGVFGSVGAPSGLAELEVDIDGKIFIPFAGRIQAEGLTIEKLRLTLTEELAGSTPDPQIQILRTAGLGSSVSVVSPGSSAAVPLTLATRRLTELLAASGVVNSTDAEATTVTVRRGNVSAEVWLSDLYDGSVSNIAIRPGDQIFVGQDRRQFTLIGELGGQGLLNFPKPELTVMEGLTLAGGLNSGTANPRGIFIFRNETSQSAKRILDTDKINDDVRVAYVLDITKPDGIFLARDMRLKDGDTILVTEAPYSQWTKVITAIFSTTGAVENLSNIRRDNP